MRRLLHILLWSIIAAAFIGPGTVTTAASSGARFGFSLLWALFFSTGACLVLQEASARVTVVSGRTLAQAVRERFHTGAVGLFVLLMVLGAILLGCAAYEAGNILGSVAGARMKTTTPPVLLTLAIGISSGLLLYFGTAKTIARFLGMIVALMGVMFLVTAVLMNPPLGALIKGTLVPSLPDGSSLLVLGLIGTTVVPYNLFLGSGLAAGQKLSELRFGLSISIVIGGVISMGILVVGTAIRSSFSFTALSDSLAQQLGGWAGTFFAAGLFAAGFSSAVTAPLAAAITARGLFDSADGRRWHERSWRYRGVWLGVLVTGIFFGVAGVKPVPAIIIAQALNGILLPFVAIFLLLIINDRILMGDSGINSWFANLIMGLIVAITIVLGVSKTTSAVTSALKMPALEERTLLLAATAVTVLLAAPIARSVWKRRM